MSPDERWFPSHLREMEQVECLDLLAAHQVGRVAYSDALGPVVLPVNYALDQTPS
jgi:nitroimidazol reductase NimA-like FMN-containing flavoprotein (pyridoxamine 5'-phosphate oxidase superfamily)